jgi:hypothetical protein
MSAKHDHRSFIPAHDHKRSTRRPYRIEEAAERRRAAADHPDTATDDPHM